MTHPPISSITIVGGGTAGWMTAALLSKLLMGKYAITLVESEEIGTIGVGEATIPAIKVFNEMLGLDEAEFMKATQGTYKLGIEFVNWRQPGHSYIHGFGRIGVDRLWLHTHQFWLKMFPKGGFKDFDHYAINCLAARKGRFAPPNASGPPLSDIDYAFQFDASLYAKYLRTIAEAAGVKRIEGRITRVDLRQDDGFIDKIVLHSGQEIGGDLFIDCSGMRGLLIGAALGVGYEDWNAWLLCDRAWAVPCESTPDLAPLTRSTARDAGWQWRIPLQHRIGNGHVYSSQYIGDDEAAAVLMANLDGKPLAEPRQVKFRPGKRHRAWEKNCVAIGLSGGFLEPLESTSIYLAQIAVTNLLQLFPAKVIDSRLRDEFNRLVDNEYDRVRDFLILHYHANTRDDGELWRYCRDMKVPDSLLSKIEQFERRGHIPRYKDGLFSPQSWLAVFDGQDIVARGYDRLADTIDASALKQRMDELHNRIRASVEAMPTHADFIRDYCAYGTKVPAMESAQ